MKAFNTLTRRLEAIEPITPGEIRLYTCGPTVYDYAHIGNFRTYVFEDILRRHLKASGLRVIQVMNLTDVDDKTIRGSQEEHRPLNEFTEQYKTAFFEDLAALNIEPAEFYPAATEHVDEMIDLIQALFNNGFAYTSDEGSVYFNIAKSAGYGALANLDTSALKPGARVAQDEYEKENASDFALWKAWDEDDGNVVWESPWGRGRPGWHIECSAMSMKYLGEQFDIHTGGVDNIFPHHVNEIAQSEGATGKPFVKYWLHSAHLIVDGRKMSKSLGNFYTLRDIFDKGYTGREVRYVLLSAHYRQQLNFTFAALDAARAALRRIDEFRERLNEAAGGQDPGAPPPAWAVAARDGFAAALDNDLSMPEALSALFDMVHAGNRALDDATVSPDQAAATQAVLLGMDAVLGVLAAADAGNDPAAERLAAEREEARRRRDWAEADRLRDELAALGWEVRDTPQGPKLKRSQI